MPRSGLAIAAFAAGAALFTALLLREGVREVAAALAVAGPGIAAVALFHLVPLLADALGWRALIARDVRASVGTVAVARWIGESVNGLLPVAQLGGNVAKARWLARRGVPAAEAGATVVVDVTLLLFTQVLFTLVGVWLLLEAVTEGPIATTATAGATAMGGVVGAFLAAQRAGMFGIAARLARHLSGGGRAEEIAGAAAAALDRRIRRLYRERGTVLAACGWHGVAWLVGAGEVWLALHFLGHPVTLATAVLLESLGQAVRVGGFFVPAALGVQEAGFVVLGRALGLPPETALALSLVKRARELLLGLPGLVVWQLDVAARRVRAPSVAGGG
jgi:putative membrane protein